jgi:hypothetical protein
MQTTFFSRLFDHRLLLSVAVAASLGCAALPLRAETPPEAAQALEQAPEPLSAEELEILVARIALYPDELVAVISAASLYPLQIVEAQRFLDDLKTKKDLKPKATWDGSVISLLNYPEVVKMMSEDLDWTQLFGEAIVNQQDDVLAAIQQLREEAVANGVIKSDEKVKVVKQEETIVIQPASKEVIYVPQYEPEMLYEPDYVYRPITYYPEPYPYYWNPAATFFAGAVTGAIWAAAVDWDDGFWGGDWNDWNDWGGNDIDIDFDCNQCIIGNDFSGKLNFNEVDWTKIDRTKINFDKNNFAKIDNSKFKDSFKNNNTMNLKDKANISNNRVDKMARPGQGGVQTKDIRKSTLDKMKKQPVKDFKPSDKMAKPGNNLQKPGNNIQKPAANLQKPGDKMARPANLDRPVGKPKPAAKIDNRPKNASPLGEVTRGRDAIKQSDRGKKAMGGGFKPPKVSGGGGGGGGKKKTVMPKHKVSGGGGRGGGRGRRG